SAGQSARAGAGTGRGAAISRPYPDREIQSWRSLRPASSVPAMDTSAIKALIEAMAASDLSELEFREDGWTLRLSRRPGALPPLAAASPTGAIPTEPTPVAA